MTKELLGNEPITLKISRPGGCEKTALSLNALDRITREQAGGSYVFHDDNGTLRMLSCESFKVNDKGNLILEVRPEGFEFV